MKFIVIVCACDLLPPNVFVLNSHQEYEDKKPLHYRDPPQPLPLSSSSRHRSHKHYHDDPVDHHIDYTDKNPRDIGRGEKRSSLSSPLPLSLPAPSRKSRDLADRLSPTGKDILSKPFMGYDEKITKLSRGSNSGSAASSDTVKGTGGGGKGKQTASPAGVGVKRNTPLEGGTGSDGEVGEGGDEGRRKRQKIDKK